MKDLIPKRYSVKYSINGELHEEEMSTIETEKRMILADFNTELDDRFFGEDWQVIERKRIETPKEQKIPGLEDYYKEEKNILYTTKN